MLSITNYTPEISSKYSDLCPPELAILKSIYFEPTYTTLGDLSFIIPYLGELFHSDEARA